MQPNAVMQPFTVMQPIAVMTRCDAPATMWFNLSLWCNPTLWCTPNASFPRLRNGNHRVTLSNYDDSFALPNRWWNITPCTNPPKQHTTTLFNDTTLRTQQPNDSTMMGQRHVDFNDHSYLLTHDWNTTLGALWCNVVMYLHHQNLASQSTRDPRLLRATFLDSWEQPLLELLHPGVSNASPFNQKCKLAHCRPSSEPYLCLGPYTLLQLVAFMFKQYSL